MDLTFWMNHMWLDIDLERNIHILYSYKVQPKAIIDLFTDTAAILN